MVNLVIQTAFLGDALLSIPLLKQLKLLRPNEAIHFVCRKGVGSIFEYLGICDKVIEVDKSNKEQWKKVVSDLAGNQYHFVICPHESIRTAFLVHKLNSKHKVGFRQWWNVFAFSSRVRRSMDLPEAMRQLELLTVLSDDFSLKYKTARETESVMVSTSIESEECVHWPTESVPEWASMQCCHGDIENQAILDQKGAVVMAPGSVWNTKRWSKEGYIELGRRLLNQGNKVCWIGSPDESDLCKEIAQEVVGSVSFAGEISLIETLQLIGVASKVVCNDSGAMHLASVAGTPSVSIFGPTTLNLGYRPWQQKAVVVQKTLPCRPCGLHGGKVCPIGTHECMTGVLAEGVEKALLGLK